MTAEQRIACIAAFEKHFEVDWKDPCCRDERDDWQAAWNAAIEWQKGRSALSDADSASAMAAPQPAQPYGWAVSACSTLYCGQYAEHDATAEAQRIGGTARAIALYATPQTQRQPMPFRECEDSQADQPMPPPVQPQPAQKTAAWFVDTEMGPMLWPAGEYAEASSYCAEDQRPQPLYADPQPQRQPRPFVECEDSQAGQPVPPTVRPPPQPLTKDDIRAAGGIVHSDGNVFFTSIEQLNKAAGITGEVK